MLTYDLKSSPCTPSEGGNESKLFFLWIFYLLVSKALTGFYLPKLDLDSPFGGGAGGGLVLNKERIWKRLDYRKIAV
jgi:hypothetical protein